MDFIAAATNTTAEARAPMSLATTGTFSYTNDDFHIIIEIFSHQNDEYLTKNDDFQRSHRASSMEHAEAHPTAAPAAVARGDVFAGRYSPRGPWTVSSHGAG